MSADVFLACSKDDHEFVRNFVRELDKRNISVFQDAEIAVGSVWQDVALSWVQSSRLVIALWSGPSLQDEWVRAEAQLALDREKLFPILIEKVRPPVGFSHLEHIDLSNWDGTSSNRELNEILSKLRRFLDSGQANLDLSINQNKLPLTYKRVSKASSTLAFIAHASVDKPRLQPLIQVLQEQKFKIWIDNPIQSQEFLLNGAKSEQNRIRFGNDWKEELRRAIGKSDVVLAIWSKDAVRGRRQQFHYEVYQGMMQKKLVQCRIDNVEYYEIGMPYTFDHIADLSKLERGVYHPELDHLMQDIARRRSRWLLR
ncbi:MAG: toll/interleukin-1 receptor domain-containing protein [Rhodomicrobium sp.]